MKEFHDWIFYVFILGGNHSVKMSPLNRMGLILINTSVLMTTVQSMIGGGEITDKLNKCRHLFKYEFIFMYSVDVTGEEEKSPLAYLLNEDCYSFAKSIIYYMIS